MEQRLRTVVELLVTVPAVLMLFGAVPWVRDSRLESDEDKLTALLTKERWTLHKAQIEDLLSRVDPHLLVKGEPLIVVAGLRSGDQSAIRTLAERGADVNRHDWGCTSLLVAVGDLGSLEMTKLLLDLGANPNLVPTASERKASKIKNCGDLLFKEGARVNSDGWSPLSVALQLADAGQFSGSSFMEIGRVLLEHGARLSPTEAAIRLEATMNVPGVIRDAALASMADLNINLKNGDTPLGVAIREENEKLVSSLLRSGADPNRADKSGKHPLEAAVSLCTPRWKIGYQEPADLDSEIVSIVKLLIASGAVSDQAQVAAAECSSPVAKLLEGKEK